MFDMVMIRRGATTCTILLVAACVLNGCRRESPVVPTPAGPIILISIDTLRADHLPSWGYDGVRTPNIDRLAAESVLFENAYSHVPLTLPSHISILTGLLPQDHGVRNNIGYSWDMVTHPPITWQLRDAGYRTGAAVSAYVLRGNTGLQSAFDSYDDAIASQTGVATGSLQRPGDSTIESAKTWIETNQGKPFFFLLHLFEPHSPWEPPEPFATEYAARPYDGEIAAADELVGDFVRFLRDRGLYESATVILLSDHGEGLGDHGELEHGIFLYREAIHVPLMIKLPSSRGATRVKSPVQLIDVAPTILTLVGISSNRQLPGRDLLSAALPSELSIYSETVLPRVHLGWSELRSLIDSTYHYIEAPTPELYLHRADPGERTNAIEENRRIYQSMRQAMDTLGRPVTAPSNVTPEEAAKLAALGYIGTLRTESNDALPDPKDRIADFEQLKVASALAHAGRQSDAVLAYRNILERNPQFADAWSLLAATYERMARYDDAIDAYKQGITNCPILADQMALSAAGVMLRTGRLDEAQAHAELALDQSPAAAHQILAGIAMARGDYETAEREASTGLDDATLRPRSSVIIAQSKAKQGHLDEALEILLTVRKEAESKQMHVEYLEFAIGDIYAIQRQWDEAERALLLEIDSFPWNLQAYANLAVVYAMDGQDDNVDSILEEMVATNPTRQAYLVAWRTLKTLGDDESASEWEKRARDVR